MRLGGTPYAPTELIAAIIRRVFDEAVIQHDGQAPESLVLTHPVKWSPVQREVLVAAARRAAEQLGMQLPDPVFVPEPVAAAQWYARDSHHEPPAVGQCVAVYDLGGGTFDVAVLERTPAGFEVLASGGIDPLGGFDFDHRLFIYLGAKYVGPVNSGLWQGLQRPDRGDAETAERRRRMQTTMRLLKEALSTEMSRSTHLPGVVNPVLVTRDEFETLIAADVDRTIDELMATLEEKDLTPADLAAIYRVGGASRTPLVGRKLEVLLPGRVRSIEDPKLVVALGAVSATPDAQRSPPPPPPTRPPISGPVGTGTPEFEIARPAAHSDTAADVSPLDLTRALADPAQLAPVSPAGENEAGPSRPGRLLRVVTLLLISLLAVAVVFGFVETAHANKSAATTIPDWQPYVNAGASAAVFLTTISYKSFDNDVERVLDTATGAFYDDFSNRLESLTQTVRDAQSVSSGNVTGAGLESIDDARALVLVAFTVTTSNAANPNQESKAWRMRISVVKVGEKYKASNVEFVQ